MTLELGETTTTKYPGLTRRFPIRLSANGLTLKAGKWYVARACMFVGNPAFECLFRCAGGFNGTLHSRNKSVIGSVDESIYLHVADEYRDPAEAYKVQWVTDITGAGSPRDAAKMAWEDMRAPNSIANVFTVTDHEGATYSVDLNEDPE